MNTVIGITGGIGAGKSVVSRICRLKGFHVYDCDSRARDIMEASDYIKNNLVATFGKDILDIEGNIRRKLLSSKVFDSPRLLEWLNRLVHAEVRKDFLDYAEQVGEMFFVESAILQSSHLADYCKHIWIVNAPLELRVGRVVERSGMLPDEVVKRMESQKKEYSFSPDFSYKLSFINNDGYESLIMQVDRLLDQCSDSLI